MRFKDHFSRQAREYAQFRPQYPDELFAFLASIAPGDQLALDCGTGSGQAAVMLAGWFQKVIAIDASAAQIANAPTHSRIEYRVAAAEATSLPNESCDAVTVAQALHWLEFERFYAEVRRILRPQGIIGVWSYYELVVAPEIKAIVRHYHDDVVGPYWPPERKMVGPGYLQLPFPFAEIDSPPFESRVLWSLDELIGYLGTWSATQRYLAAQGADPREAIADELARAWGDETRKRLMTWPLTVRIGRA